MQKLFVNTSNQLHDLSVRLESSPWLSVDTEFIREDSHFPHLSLIQIANREIAACIDPLSLGDLSDLSELLFRSHIVKVFHAPRQNLEIFYHLWQKVPQPVFDTQLAAVLVGLGFQPGYAATVKALLGMEIDKRLTRTDWTQRPLSAGQVRYALNDVIYLGQIYDKLSALLSSEGRSHWLENDLKQIVDPSNFQPAPEKQWLRIHGSNKLNGKRLATLKRLASWREGRAIEQNLPRKWILKDEVIFTLSKRMPCDLEELIRIPGMTTKLVELFGKRLLAEIDVAKTISQNTRTADSTVYPQLTLRQEAIVDVLTCAIKLRASEENISPAAIAPRKELEKLVLGNLNISVLRGWLAEMIGNDLLQLLNGTLHPVIKHGRIALETSVTS